MPLIYKGSVRGYLIAIGLLSYFFYQYFMYALGWAFSPLFLVYILVYILCMSGIVLAVSGINTKKLAEKIGRQFPEKGMAILCFAIVFLLIGMWLQRIVAAWQGDYEKAMLFGQTTLVVQALDLGLIVPLALFTGVTILKRIPVGYILGSILAIKSVSMGGAISAMILSAWVVEKSLEVIPLVIFLAITIISAYLSFRMYKSIPNKTE